VAQRKLPLSGLLTKKRNSANSLGRDALMSFFAERRPTRTQKLCFALWGFWADEVDLDDIPLSPHLSALSALSDRLVSGRHHLFLCAIATVRAVTFLAPAGRFEEGSALVPAFPDIQAKR
jgi:hypothetical protein